MSNQNHFFFVYNANPHYGFPLHFCTLLWPQTLLGTAVVYEKAKEKGDKDSVPFN